MSETLACPCCAQPMRTGRTRKSKPYFVCDECGVQVFIRKKEGIERLAARQGPGHPEEEFWSP